MRIVEQRKRVEEQRALLAKWERDDYPADRIHKARELLNTMTNILDQLEVRQQARVLAHEDDSVDDKSPDVASRDTPL
jgi:hypothetical protein